MFPVARRGLIVFLAGLALIAAAFAFDYWWIGPLGTSENLGVAIGGPFTLVDQNGAVRHDSDFRGKLMLIYFGYSFCPDVCPTALQTMTVALETLGSGAKEVEPLFITVDPSRDTVAQMKIYAANFDPRLVALTGTQEQVEAAARAYRIYFSKSKEGDAKDLDYLVDHSSFIYLMGRDGKYLAHFAPDVSADTMAAAIKKYL